MNLESKKTKEGRRNSVEREYQTILSKEIIKPNYGIRTKETSIEDPSEKNDWQNYDPFTYQQDEEQINSFMSP